MSQGDLAAAVTKERTQVAARSGESIERDGQTQQLVSHFLTSITNEFRTPLAALNASVAYLLEDMDSLTRSEIRELLHPIHLSVIGLHTLIDNVIESANIEAGHFAMRTGAIDPMAVVSEAIRFTRPLVSRRRQRVIVEQPDAVPFVKGDPARLTQVMVNLLSNASRFGPMNQTIRVVLECCDQEQLRVTVADQGSGLGTAEEEGLFGPSALPKTTSARPYGLGLGLSVTRTIIAEHGGAVGVKQRPGGGTLFWFTIPTVERRKGG